MSFAYRIRIDLNLGSYPRHGRMKIHFNFLPARRYASAGNSDSNVSVSLYVRLSVFPSRAGIVSKRRKL